jgi:hypothetical protein
LIQRSAAGALFPLGKRARMHPKPPSHLLLGQASVGSMEEEQLAERPGRVVRTIPEKGDDPGIHTDLRLRPMVLPVPDGHRADPRGACPPVFESTPGRVVLHGHDRRDSARLVRISVSLPPLRRMAKSSRTMEGWTTRVSCSGRACAPPAMWFRGPRTRASGRRRGRSSSACGWPSATHSGIV